MKLKIALLTLVLTMVPAKFAAAHAFLDHSNPKVGSTVDAAPTQVILNFTQEIEPEFSSIKVFDANGMQVDKDNSTVDEKDASILTVSTPGLSPGTYRVEWMVTSVDTHKTHGSFQFTVKTKG